eukprot:scaffold32184_cov60-Phaeocystis_antarctica.AAC.3
MRHLRDGPSCPQSADCDGARELLNPWRLGLHARHLLLASGHLRGGRLVPRLLQASAGRARPVAERGPPTLATSPAPHARHLTGASPAGACRVEMSRCDALRSAAQATYHEGLLGWLAEQARNARPRLRTTRVHTVGPSAEAEARLVLRARPGLGFRAADRVSIAQPRRLRSGSS